MFRGIRIKPSAVLFADVLERHKPFVRVPLGSPVKDFLIVPYRPVYLQYTLVVKGAPTMATCRPMLYARTWTHREIAQDPNPKGPKYIVQSRLPRPRSEYYSSWEHPP